MAKKVKLPFWLSTLLGMLLGMLVILIVIAPQGDDQPVDASPSLQHTKPPTPQQAQQATTAQHQPAAKLEHHSPSAATTLAVKKPHPKEPTVVIAQKGHGIALVIDDVGYDLMAVKRILNLSVPVAISVLPNSPFARQAATLSKQAGQVVMLHLPMQPEDPSLQMGDGFLRANMSRDDVRQTFLRDLKKVPYVEGTNNHMGSKLTQIDSAMQWVMQLCRENGLFFVDSKTTAHSVAAHHAQQAGIAWASRRIFLDHEMTLEAMQQAWQRARNCAAKQRQCIVIAHPRAKTVAFLENYLSADDASLMVSIKQLLHPGTAESFISRNSP